MNAGLGTLTLLKRRLLPAASLPLTDWDAEIAALGLGVARWFEAQCDRRFARVENETYLCRGGRTHLVLPRYPVESVALVEVLVPGADAWTTSETPRLLYPQSGLLEFLAPVGPLGSQLRITFTGGYWFDVSDDHSGVLPAGAMPLPDDLLRAWLEQAASLFENRARLGLEKYVQEGSAFTMAPGALLPQVAAILNGYRRYFLS